MKKALTIAGVAIAAISIPAMAEMERKMVVKQHMKSSEPVTRASVETRVTAMFKSLDANADGSVTREEIAATRAKKAAEMRGKHFSKMDSNSDGAISKSEFDAAHQARAEGTTDRRAKMDEHRAKMEEHHAKMAEGGGKPASGERRIVRIIADGDNVTETTEVRGADGKEVRHKMIIRQRHGGGQMMGGGFLFERADANKDGKVTLAEALAKPLARFDEADTNRDGTLSPDERKSAHEKIRAKWQSKAS